MCQAVPPPTLDALLTQGPRFRVCGCLLQGMALLTGPNMAGKSTILRSVCAVALLGACGLYAPAHTAAVPYFGGWGEPACVATQMGEGKGGGAGKAGAVAERKPQAAFMHTTPAQFFRLPTPSWPHHRRLHAAQLLLRLAAGGALRVCRGND